MRIPLPGASALAAVVLAASPTRAQPDPLPLSPVIDAGVAAGLGHTTRWYESDDDSGTLTPGPALSADVRYWPVPVAGLRLQVGTFSADLRGRDTDRSQVLGVSYDASVVLRPFALSSVPVPLSSVYAYGGGGAVTLAVTGRDSVVTCDGDRCQLLRPRPGTVGQLTAGLGAEFGVGGGYSAFAEASVGRYEPRFERREVVFPRALQAGPASANATPAAVTRRLLVGVRRTLRGGRPDAPLAPPPPPAPAPASAPSPTTGGYVEVRTAAPGAEVYLVPRTALEDDPNLLCRLRPVVGDRYFRGRTTAAAGVRAYAAPSAWVVIVRQNGREFQGRIQPASGRVRTFTLDMRVDGAPYRCRR